MGKQQQRKFRRPQVSQNDQIMRDRNKFEKQNQASASLLVAHPELAGGCVGLLEWAAIVADVPIEDDGSELVVKG